MALLKLMLPGLRTVASQLLTRFAEDRHQANRPFALAKLVIGCAHPQQTFEVLTCGPLTR